MPRFPISMRDFSLRLILPILICLAVSISARAQAPEGAPAGASANVSAALRARDFDRAIALSRDALKQNPRDAQLWTLQGIAFASKGDAPNAEKSFQQALTISPKNMAALAGAAQIEYQQGSQKAVPLLNRLLEVQPDDPTANAMHAVLDYQAHKCSDAVTHFERAGALVNQQPDALHAFASCLVHLKRYDAAIAVLQKSLELNPADAKEVEAIASVQLMAGKPQDALATLAPMLHAENPDPGVLQLASAAYEETADTPQAVALLRQALVANPKDISLYVDFANICFTHQSFQVGVDVISEGLTLLPQADDLYVARGVLYVQLAQYDKAEADFQKAYEINPNQSMSIAAQGLTAVQSNDLDAALKSIQEKLRTKPSDPLLLYLQADILTQKGPDPGTPAFDLAVRSAKRALALQPNFADAHSVLSKLYMQAGRYPETIQQCQLALESNPGDQAAVYRLIQAYRKTGQTKDIPELLKRLATLREEATKKEAERNRFKLLEDEPPPKP
jgi:tetratricopeptide (TPR) repeat protein